MTSEHIVIVGFGWVGQANAIALSLMGYQVSFFDVGNPPQNYPKYVEQYKRIKKLDAVLEIDSSSTIYMVCVGDRVSEDGTQDISSIKSALGSLKGAKGLVILRSTILPGYLKDLQFDIYVPEFLHEKYAVEECIKPYYFIVGKKNSDALLPTFFNDWRKNCFKYLECTPEEASHIKYLSNLWNSIRVAFVNEFGCTIVEPYSEEEVEKIDKIMTFLFENKAYLRYGRSFGGHCLPKDTRAYTRWAKDNGKHVALLEGVLSANEAHRSREEKHHHLPQWFSKWQKPELSGWVALEQLFKSIGRKVKRLVS